MRLSPCKVLNFGFPKDSCLLASVNAELRRLEEAGVLRRLQLRHGMLVGMVSLVKPSRAESSSESLGFRTMLLPFLGLLVGCVAGTALVLVEVGRKRAATST